MTLAAGTKLGPYEVIAPIGAGGMGEVYRARDPRIGREVALKILPASVADRSDRLQRFEAEARAAGALNHPNLVTVFDVGTVDGIPYIVTELLDGVTLRERIPLTQKKAVEYAVQIATGVAAAHERGIVHRDLKPENVFITSDDRVKLLDFGLAKLRSDAISSGDSKTIERLTDPNVVVGTAPYMSPEQVRGQAVDHRSDVFSFGTMLVEMLTGVHPFRRESHIETMHAILNEEPQIANGAIAPGFERLVSHAIAKNPSHRFQSMRDMAFALEMISGTSETAPVKVSKRKREPAPVFKVPTFKQVTFRRGYVMTARVARDGSVIYGAAWEDKPLELYASIPGEPEARSLGVADADVLAVSPAGELAVSLGRRYIAGWVTSGTLARLPLAGGAPRRIVDEMQDADWSPDGKNLAIIRRSGDLYVIEYPIGSRVYESAHWISHVRVSPKDDRIAFLDHAIWGDDGGSLVIIDKQGKKLVQTETWKSVAGLAWTPRGDEVLVTALGENAGRDLLAVSVSGKMRTLLAMPGRLQVHDVTPDGSVLVTFDIGRREVLAGVRGQSGERNLTWFDWSFVTDMSSDGNYILVEEQGTAARGTASTIYYRPVDGGPAVHFGDGRARAISPDGKWIVRAPGVGGQLELVPTGAGASRVVTVNGLEAINWWYWFPDGKRLLLWGNQQSHGRRMYEVAVDGDGTIRPVGPEGVNAFMAISPDCSSVAAISPQGEVTIYATDNGREPRALDGAQPGEQPVLWGRDNAIYVVAPGRIESAIYRIDITTGERKLWQPLKPADPAGIVAIFPTFLSADAQSYVYGYRRFLSELHIIKGLL